MHNPFKVVEMFEENLAEYTKAPYAVAVDSCTNAIMLSCLYNSTVLGESSIYIEIPSNTYLSVPQAIMHSGYDVKFREEKWKGKYQLKPLNVYDSAKLLTSEMYIPGTYMCLSFHHKKLLPIGKGGAILTDDLVFVEWAKQIRYEGRSPYMGYHDDDIKILGYNMYMTPEEAARGLTLLSSLPLNNDPQIEDPDYRDLRTFSLWKDK